VPQLCFSSILLTGLGELDLFLESDVEQSETVISHFRFLLTYLHSLITNCFGFLHSLNFGYK